MLPVNQARLQLLQSVDRLSIENLILSAHEVMHVSERAWGGLEFSRLVGNERGDGSCYECL